jgi:DinB superfamily
METEIIGSLSEQERCDAIDELRGALQEFEDLTAGLPPTAWERKSSPDEWSPLEIMEHMMILEERVATVILPKLLQSEPTPLAGAERQEWEKKLAEGVSKSERKVHAPPPAQPRGACTDGPEGCAKFRGLREKNIAYVESTGDPLRAHQLPHPLFGPLDGYQWILVLAAHNRRHNQQLARAVAG